jgi:solute carrier family 25 protein 34/35
MLRMHLFVCSETLELTSFKQCIVMQPADTGLTRVYNQEMVRTPDGRLVGKTYRNLIDCLWKTARTEGLRGWYKGSTAQFMRLAPHTSVLLVMVPGKSG